MCDTHADMWDGCQVTPLRLYIHHKSAQWQAVVSTPLARATLFVLFRSLFFRLNECLLSCDLVSSLGSNDVMRRGTSDKYGEAVMRNVKFSTNVTHQTRDMAAPIKII